MTFLRLDFLQEGDPLSEHTHLFSHLHYYLFKYDDSLLNGDISVAIVGVAGGVSHFSLGSSENRIP